MTAPPRQPPDPSQCYSGARWAKLRSERKVPVLGRGTGQSPERRAEPEPCRAPCRELVPTHCAMGPGLPRQRRHRAGLRAGLRARPGPSGETAAIGPGAGPCRAALSGGIAEEPCWRQAERSALPCPALPCAALRCPALPALPCPARGSAPPGVPAPPCGVSGGGRDSRQDTAVQTALHATRGNRAGTGSALTHRCWLRAGQGCPPLPRIPAASRAPLRSGRAPPRERQLPSRDRRSAARVRPPALAAPARSGWDGMGAAGSGAAAAGRAAGAGAVARTPSPWERAAALGGSPSHRPLLQRLQAAGTTRRDGRAPRTAELPAAPGARSGARSGGRARASRQPTPASRQKVPW